MKLTNFEIYAVRNEREYNQYVPELYKKDYPYTKNVNWVILIPQLEESAVDEAKDVEITFTPEANTSNLKEVADVVTKFSGNKGIKVDFNKAQNYIIIDAKTELGFKAFPSSLTATAKTTTGNVITSSFNVVSIEDKENTLKNIEKYIHEGGNNPQMVGELLSQIIDKVATGDK